MQTKQEKKKELLDKANYANEVLIKTIDAKCALEVLKDIGAFDNETKKVANNVINNLSNLEMHLLKIRDQYVKEYKEL